MLYCSERTQTRSGGQSVWMAAGTENLKLMGVPFGQNLEHESQMPGLGLSGGRESERGRLGWASRGPGRLTNYIAGRKISVLGLEW